MNSLLVLGASVSSLHDLTICLVAIGIAAMAIALIRDERDELATDEVSDATI